MYKQDKYTDIYIQISYLADICISNFYIPAYIRKENFNRLFLYLNHLFLPRILITQYSIHIYMSFSVYITRIVSHPRFDSTIEFRSGFSKGRTILQR